MDEPQMNADEHGYKRKSFALSSAFIGFHLRLTDFNVKGHCGELLPLATFLMYTPAAHNLLPQFAS